MQLETSRLILRTPQTKDYLDLWKNGQDQNISLYTNVVPYPFTQIKAREFIQFCQRANAKKTTFQFVMELKSSHEVIGYISLHHLAKDARNAELGYWIGLNYRRQGITTEAIKKVLEFAFKELKLEKVYTRIAYPNRASREIMRKFNFKLEGIARRQMCRQGVFMDRYDFGLLKEEYSDK